MGNEHGSFHRFSLNERIQHAILFITVTLLALTGFPQKYSNLGWARTMVEFMGGIGTVRLIHRINAAILLAAFVYHAVYGLYRLLIKRAPFEMLPRPKDVRDFLHNIGYYLGVRETRPRFDRFSYIEKFDYWAVFWGMAIMGGSGLILWFPTIVTRFLPGVVVPIATAAHSDEALLAISAIVLWHLYNAHLNPRVFPFNRSIFTGRLSKHDMMEEHPLEYERRTGGKVPEGVLRERPAVSWSVLLVSGLLGASLVALYGVMIVLAIRPPSPPVLSPANTPIARQKVMRPAPSPTPGVFAGGPPISPSATSTPVPTQREFVSQQGPVVSHSVAGERQRCNLCHEVDGLIAAPEDHGDYPEDECLDCHEPVLVTPESASDGG